MQIGTTLHAYASISIDKEKFQRPPLFTQKVFCEIPVLCLQSNIAEGSGNESYVRQTHSMPQGFQKCLMLHNIKKVQKGLRRIKRGDMTEVTHVTV